MPLLKNTHQQYFPDPNTPARKSCAGQYCYPIALGDPIYQQFYQTPCGQNLIDDPNFSNASFGANLITNGTFATDLSGWTTGGWIWDAGQAEAPVLTDPNDLTQAVAITPNTFYRITFDLSGLSAGDELRVYLGRTAGWYSFTSNGSYDQIIRAGSDNTDIALKAGVGNLANALVDNLTLEEVTWGDWDTNGTWTLNVDDGIACADAAGTGQLIETVSDYITPGGYYKLAFTVSNYVAGSFVVNVADVTDNAATTIEGNGDYELYFSPTLTGVVAFTPSADFIGCLSGLDLRALKNDYTGDVVDSDGNRYDISEYFQYFEDKVTIDQPLFDLLELPYDCYTIEIVDSCLVEGVELVTNGDFASGYTDWTRNNGYDQYNLNAGGMEFVFEPLEGATILTNGDFSGGTTGWTVGAGWGIAGGLATHTPGSTATLAQTVTIGAPAVPPNVLVHWFQFTISGRTAGSVTVTLGNVSSAAFSTNQIITHRLIPTVGGSVTFSFTPTSDFDGSISLVALHAATRPWSDFVILRNVANAGFVTGNFALEYDLVSNTTVQDNGGMAIGIVGQTQSLSYDTTEATHTRSITGYTPGGQQVYLVARFSSGGVFFPGRIRVDDVSAVRVEPFDATYFSECMKYDFEHEDTVLLTGWCEREAFGFDFTNTGFKLQMRALVRGMSPSTTKTKLVSEYGTGDAEVTYAASTKKWMLATDFMSESAHDALSAMIDCDHFTIGNSDADAIEYVANVEDYTPQWRAEGDYDLAPAIITLRLKEGGQKFNRHY